VALVDIAIKRHDEAIDRLRQRFLERLAAGERFRHIAEAHDKVAVLILLNDRRVDIASLTLPGPQA
jgi:hypothetical protein